MKKIEIILLLLIISMFFVISPIRIWAEERNIYVGDLIQLKVQAQDLTLDELKDKFKDFDIVNVSNISDGYILTLRSFETGEKIIQLGDKEVKIVVKSTLDEIERNEVFEGDVTPEGVGFYVKWKYILFTLIGVFLLTLAFNLRLFLKKRKTSSLKPYQRFIKGISDLSVDQNDYLVNLTMCFKEYLESSYSFRIKGKTSTEIINEIDRMSGFNEKLPEIKSWLRENDYYKFSGTAASMAKKLSLMENLTELVGRIEETKEGEIQ